LFDSPPLVSAFHPLSGSPCTSTSDCLPDGWEFCSDDDGNRIISSDNKEGLCKHKSLYPMKGVEYWGMIAIFWALWVFNMGGVGGGGIVIPIVIIFFKFDAKNAVALSNFSIFLSSLMRWLIFLKDKHPLKKGKGLMLDYNVAIICLPLIIAGVSIGVIVHIIMP